MGRGDRESSAGGGNAEERLIIRQGSAMAGERSSRETNTAAGRRAGRGASRPGGPAQAFLASIERLHATLDAGAIAASLLEILGGMPGAGRRALYLAGRDARRLELRGAVGLDAPEELPSIRVDSNLVRWLIEAAGSVRLDELFASGALTAGGDEEAIRTLSSAGLERGIALAVQGTLFGVLLCGGTPADGSETADDERLAALARSASHALGNAALHEAALSSRLDLERFSRVKGELVERASSELATSLAVVTNSLWSLEPEGVGDRVLIDMARDALARLQSAVERLASFGDIDLDGSRFAFEPGDVSGLVEDVLREFVAELEEKQIEVDSRDGAIDRKALIDAGKLKFVVRSMIDTAIKHTARGGTICVETRVTETRPGAGDGIEICGAPALPARPREGAEDLRERETNERAASSFPARSVGELGGSPYVVVSVAEGGGDISPEEMNALAGPAEPSSSRSTRNITDPLPGLAISREIIAGHGGRLFYARAPEEGARFSLWLPLSV